MADYGTVGLPDLSAGEYIQAQLDSYDDILHHGTRIEDDVNMLIDCKRLFSNPIMQSLRGEITQKICLFCTGKA